MGQTRSEAGFDTFTTVGYFKSGMSEYDSTHVYVPLEALQKSRLLYDHARGIGAVNQIQIKVKPGVDIDQVARKLQLALDALKPMFYRVSTWEQKQGPLLGAVAIEQSILNILLFFIIAVAGFGILAIFSMIVVEKTRDIGVMKALGASTAGIRGIFLGYGLLLGALGSGVGMAGGLLFVQHINEIERLLSRVTGRKVFDDTIYYFDKIPTIIDPLTVCWIVTGALLIAVGASIWPAQRAARLHPVRALRYE
jgi:lipoprotein-releasing system permease protein